MGGPSARLRRGVLAVLLLAALALGAGWAVNRVTAPPDVAAVARSPEVEAAGRRAVAEVDGRIAAVAGLEPRLVPAATDVDDWCGTGYGPFVGGGYEPVACSRSVIAFYGFDGDPATAAAWYDRVGAAGWRGGPGPSGAAGPPPPASFSHPDGGGSVTVEWSTCPDAPDVPLRPRSEDSDTVVHRAGTYVGVDSTVREICARYGHVAAVRADREYFRAPE